MNKTLLIIAFLSIFLIQSIESGFTGADIYSNKIEQPDSVIKNQFKYGYAPLSPFSGSVFGTAYVGTDKNAYAYFLKNGKKKKNYIIFMKFLTLFL